MQATNGRNGNGYLVDLRQVVKTYSGAAGTFTALKGIDLQVKAGEFVTIVGKSGCGKSTLINVITGIDRPTSGEVLVGGAAVHALAEGQIAVWRGRTIGVVFQFFQLLPTLTAIENVMLAMDFARTIAPGERFGRAMRLLEQVDMAAYAHQLPLALSGGQQQSVAIARALANDPPLVAADEPTGNLDSKNGEAVMELLRELHRGGATICMVTHDPRYAGLADRSIHLFDGHVVEERVGGNGIVVGNDTTAAS
jgi:putative ABC transport system ATP-binding protein